MSVICAALGVAACSPSEGQQKEQSLEPPPLTVRADLTASQLHNNSDRPDSPVDNSYYLPVGDSGTAAHRFEGTVYVPETEMSGTGPNRDFGVVGLRYFPGFSAEFFSHQDHLIPTVREIIPGNGQNSYWDILLSPGRVWTESADEGMSRASFPFVLVSNLTNETHNGVATFLFDDNRVSDMFFQVVQETASWNREDYWGGIDIAYLPGQVVDRDRLVHEFDQELRSQTPIRSWQDIADDGLWHRFNRGLAATDVSAAGLVVEGTVYMRPCATRYGPSPYCESMRHGAFSLTKSLAAGLALLRLAQKYGDSVVDLGVTDYVGMGGAHNAWDRVTFGDALNMATGIGGNNPDFSAVDPFADETADNYAAWASAATTEQKLAVAHRAPAYPWAPGRVFRYNTAHTFVLAVAMDRYLKSMEGPQAELWAMLVAEVFRPIGIIHAPTMRTAETAGPGVPLMGIGMYPTVGDIAKIGTLLQSEGRHQGEQLLSPTLLADALFQTGKGLPTGELTPHGAARYHLSFWSLPYRGREGCKLQLPYMSGFGGNFMMLAPNGVVSFRFADADLYDIVPLAETAEQLGSFCIR